MIVILLRQNMVILFFFNHSARFHITVTLPIIQYKGYVLKMLRKKKQNDKYEEISLN